MLITSGELSKKGKATFDGIAVQKKWGEANADFMAKLVKVIADADASLPQQPGQPGAPIRRRRRRSPARSAASRRTPPRRSSSMPIPTAEQQASAAWLGGGEDGGAAKALKATADFLEEQKRIDTVAPDYSAFVTPKYVEAALKLK